MSNDKDKMQAELEAQKRIAYTAGLLQGDITIRTFLESLAEGVVVINTEGRIVLINQRMEELFGYTRLEVQGENISMLIPEKQREQHQRHIAAYFTQPRVRPMGIGMDLMGQRKNGTEIPVEVSLSVLEVDTGRIGLAFITDITARKTTEQKLKEKNQQLDEFASVVAHDLNSDVSTIVGLSEMLIDPEESFSPREQQEFLREIATGGRKLSEIIRELLLFARMEKGDFVASPLNMATIVANARQRLKRQISESGAVIQVKEFEHTAIGYGPWLEEVWFNYISNALKYGGTPPVIEIDSHKENDTVIYRIRDNGSGLAPEDVELVFNEDSEARKSIIRGNGIGLTIVRKMIERLAGQVWVTSAPGEGAVFSFSLPGA